MKKLIVCLLSFLVGAVVASVHHAEVVAHRVGEPFGARFGLQGTQTGYGESMASAFFEEFCGKLAGYGVAIHG